MKSSDPDTPAKAEEVDAARIKESLAALSVIHRGLTKLQLQQLRDRHRLDLHSETNNSNYHNVFTGSVFETGVFIMVAIFQVNFTTVVPISLIFLLD